MTLPSDIPAAIYEWAELFCDAHRDVEDDRMLVALAVIEGGRVLHEVKPDTFGLNKRQSDALAFIEGFIDENGYTPTFAEISVGLGLQSRSGAHRLVQQLIDRGAVRRLPGRTQSLVIVRAA